MLDENPDFLCTEWWPGRRNEAKPRFDDGVWMPPVQLNQSAGRRIYFIGSPGTLEVERCGQYITLERELGRPPDLKSSPLASAVGG